MNSSFDTNSSSKHADSLLSRHQRVPSFSCMYVMFVSFLFRHIICKIHRFFTKCNQTKKEKRKNTTLTTKVKSSILATMWPLVTFTVCPDGVKFPLNTGEHCISVHLNTTPPHNNRQTRHYTLLQPPGIYPNSMIIYCPAEMHKEAIFMWDFVGGVFISPPNL